MNKGQILEQYYNLTQELKEMEAKQAALRSMIKEFGDCKANGFQSFVDEQERRSISLVDIEKSDRKLYETLLEKQLVKQNKILIVKVKKV